MIRSSLLKVIKDPQLITPLASSAAQPELPPNLDTGVLNTTRLLLETAPSLLTLYRKKLTALDSNQAPPVRFLLLLKPFDKPICQIADNLP